ncbi:5-oxoprolinase subunit PxpB [Lonsdalea quercina]|uniref:5-oxoprolinase subunit PxpB n=1 Tax=Lonsdalea quercina TaxID=71657 RepID=UPI0039753D5B
MQQVRCYLLGESAAVLELAPPAALQSQQRIWALAERLRGESGVEEVIPGMNNLTVILAQPVFAPTAVLAQLRHAWDEISAKPQASREVDIPVIYGGAHGQDLAHVAAHCGMTPRQVVECHAATRYVVYFIGFQPGFAYLGDLDARLHIPRRAEPRLQVPAGSVGIGGHQTGIYPLSTPGGWQLIGRTELSLFTPESTPPTLLRPGDRVRFVPQREGLC